MDLAQVEKIAATVLYEGYLLYPYRPSAVKNRKRFNFGVLTPATYSLTQSGGESSFLQTECLAWCASEAVLGIKVRFLHLRDQRVFAYRGPDVSADGAEPEFHRVEVLDVEGQSWFDWQEAVEREVVLPAVGLAELAAKPQTVVVTFSPEVSVQLLLDRTGRLCGRLEREIHATTVAVEVAVLERECQGPGEPTQRLKKIRVRVENRTQLEAAGSKQRDEVLARSLVSTHTILGLSGGGFISLLDPPPGLLREEAANCRNVGAWPVLAGDPGQNQLMLASPIILSDYPQVAPESAGDFFDGTEMDEMLALRVMTLTEEEKRAMRDVDDRARRILERTEALPKEHLLKLHGVVRGWRPL